MRPSSKKEKIIALAEDQHAKDGELELDGGAQVSSSFNNGAWVTAWVWVDFTGTELDKENGNGG